MIPLNGFPDERDACVGRAAIVCHLVRRVSRGASHLGDLVRGMWVAFGEAMLLGHVSPASAVHSDALGPIRLGRRAERSRLDRHFRRVVRHLRRHTPAGLTGQARRNRARHIEELERYRRRGVFPKNVRHPGRRLPIFVDDVGTRCAMGHLIEHGGGGDLVRHVASRHNLARVHQLAALPAFVAWLADNGLTVDEAALIQPSYCEAASNCVCAYGCSNQGMLEGEAIAAETGMSLTISAVHGDVGELIVGDTIALGQYTQAEVGDRVVASLNENGALTGEWIIDGEHITVQDCSFVAAPPGPLPVDAFVDASLADGATCEAILEEVSPAWTEPQGDCGGYPGDPGEPGNPFDPGDPGEPGLPFFPSEPTDGGAREAEAGDGCAIKPGMPGDVTSVAILLLGAGWFLARRRR